MHIRMAQKANLLLHKYKIRDFPIPLHVIEQIILDEHVKIIIRKNINHACILGDDLLVGDRNHNCRYQLTHEYLHIREHPNNYFQKDETIIAKNESQANAFAAYFLMPIGMFETSMKYAHNSFELAEEYGVTPSFVEYRKMLTKGLIDSREYHWLKQANLYL